jgi:nucleotide-binding universal stress UspA family protein
VNPELPPPGPIIVGVERSERSRDALALAATLARAVGSRVILVAVYPADARSATMARRPYARALANAADAALEWAARPFAGVRAESRAVACNSVARALQDVAKTEAALAILIGSSHRGPLGRIVVGDVGWRLLREAPCAVAIVPRGHRGVCGRMRRIGVGYVKAAATAGALGTAADLAAVTDAAVRVLSVIEPAMVTLPAIPARGSGYAEVEDSARADLTRDLQREIDRAAAPVQISGEVVDGYADDELARLSDDVDLLVCGSHSRGAPGRVALGSVSGGVMRKARCPVMVVPRGPWDGFAGLAASSAIAS